MAVRTITTRLALDGEAQFKQAMTSVNASLRAMKSEMALSEAQFKGQANSVEALTAKDKLLRQEIEQQTVKVRALEQALKDAAQVYGEDSNQVSNYQAQLNRAKTELLNMNQALEVNEGYLKEANENFFRHATSIDEYGNKVNEAVQSNEGLEDSYVQLATAIKAAGVALSIKAIVDVLKDCVSTSMDFNAAMSNVAATLDVPVGQLDRLKESATELGGTTQFTSTQVAEAYNYMALAGYDVEKSLEAMPSVLNLAAAGNIELARSSDMVTDAQSALRLSSEETEALVDQMAMTASKSNTSVEQLGDAILEVGGNARFLAGGTAELTQVLGLLADNSIKGTEGGTKLRNMILSLSAPTEKAAAQLDELGVSIFDAEGNMRAFSEIFPELQSSLSRLTDQQQLEALSEIFNTRDIAAAQALLGTTAERWGNLAVSIDDAQGAAERMAKTKMDNLAGDLTLLQSAMDNTKKAIGDSLEPALRNLAQAGAAGISWAGQLIDDQPWIVDAIVGITNAFIAFTLATKAHAAATKVASIAQAAFNVVMSANPVAKVVAVVAGLVTALGLLISRLSSAREKTEELNDAQESQSDAGDEAAQVGEEIARAMEAAAQATEGATEAAEDNTDASRDQAVALGELEDATLYLAGANDTLAKALKEQEEAGSLSLKTALDLIEAGYGAALAIDDETGAVTLNRDSYLRLADARISDQIAALETQKQALITAARVEAEALAAQHAGSAYWEMAAAKLYAEKSDTTALDAQIAAMTRLRSTLGQVTTQTTRAARTSRAASRQAKTQAQEDMEAYKQVKAELDHDKAMELVSEEDYYRQLAGYRDRYLTDDANVSEYRKVTEQIYKYDRSLAEQELQLWENQTDGLIRELEQRVKSVIDQQDRMAARLEGYGDLFRMEDNTMTLNSIQEQIDAINEYEDALNALKARNISGGLMEEVLNMDVDSATQYARQLLEMSEEQWREYNDLWDEKQRRAMEVAEQFFKDQLDALENEYNDKLGAALDNLTDTSFGAGVDTGQGLIDGLSAMEGELYAKAQDMADQVSAILAGAGRIPSNSELAASMSTERIAERYQGVTNRQLQSAVAGGVNGLSSSLSNQAVPKVDVTLTLNDRVLAEEMVDPLRDAQKSRPEIKDDK